MPPIRMEGEELGDELNCTNCPWEIDGTDWEEHTSINVHGYFPQLKSHMLRGTYNKGEQSLNLIVRNHWEIHSSIFSKCPKATLRLPGLGLGWGEGGEGRWRGRERGSERE